MYLFLDIDFLKTLKAGLERIFFKFSILVPDDHIKFKSNKLMDKINYYMKEYEKNILDNHTLGNNSMQQLPTYDKNIVLGIENIIPKIPIKSEVNYSIQNLLQQNKCKKEVMENSLEYNMTLNNLPEKNNDLQKRNSETLIVHHFPKKPKLMSSDVLNRSTTTGIFNL